MTIRVKILTAVVASILVLILSTLAFTFHRLHRMGDEDVERFRSELISRQVATIRDQVEAAYSLVKPYADSGEAPEVKTRAKEILSRIRYGTAGYVFA